MNQKWKPGDVCVSDIEGNNLLYLINQYHCGSVLNPFTLVEKVYGPDEHQEYLAELSRHGVVVGHNFKGFDLLALKKLFSYIYEGFCFDTMILSRLLNPERKLHSLESYGYQFKFRKGDYKDSFRAKLLASGKPYVEGMEWWEFNQDMLDYCVQDVRLNAVLFLYFIIGLDWCEWFGSTKSECQRLMKAIKAGDIQRG